MDVAELGALALRAQAEVAQLQLDDSRDFDLEYAYEDLARQLIIVQALEIRRDALNMPAPPPDDHVVASETPEAIAAESEEEEPVEEPPEPPAPAAFKVRPKSAERWCSDCGLRQWKSPGGWVCENGHGGASRVYMPTCLPCFQPMFPVVDDEDGSLIAVSCKCGASQAFAEIADPGS